LIELMWAEGGMIMWQELQPDDPGRIGPYRLRGRVPDGVPNRHSRHARTGRVAVGKHRIGSERIGGAHPGGVLNRRIEPDGAPMRA
jgi:hypothetical protein